MIYNPKFEWASDVQRIEVYSSFFDFLCITYENAAKYYKRE